MKKAISILVLFVCSLQMTQAQTCQCVNYVKNRYTIVGGVGANGGAKDYGPILTNTTNNFSLVTTPQNKDIIVMQPGFGNGVNTTYGHIALVGTVTNNSNGTQTLVLYGANQGGTTNTEWCCSNVSAWTVTLTATNKKFVSFYRNLSKLKTVCP